ncbi:hypothetical protein G6R29_03835 [Fructobacillus sp. M2-14]|uniref:Competence protein ComGD n=1 Tax=Fructobacillus broussonetiae TaxID=2713173 RepID=A0ABS5QZZ8_9LACO|nr:hypothetical protein [Fructobacillus broussonetiae]MBS9338754.1 hypothetical protein [Fructobacillus broussonetiae]
MLNRRAAFTLVESLLVLGMVSLLLFLAVLLRPQSYAGMEITTFEKRFSILYQKERLLAQEKERILRLTFDRESVWSEEEELPFPVGYQMNQREVVQVSSSGFVSPRTIIFSNTQKKKQLKLVFLFGGGDYYFEEK